MTSEEFFPQLHIPVHWKRVGKNDVPNSLGWVYDDRTTQTIYRVFYNIDSEKGGITERKRTESGKPKYKCLISNKNADDINEFINQNLR
jgi:hypothetical protein